MTTEQAHKILNATEEFTKRLKATGHGFTEQEALACAHDIGRDDLKIEHALRQYWWAICHCSTV